MRNHDFSNDVLRHVRAVHSNISDGEWAELINYPSRGTYLLDLMVE